MSVEQPHEKTARAAAEIGRTIARLKEEGLPNIAIGIALLQLAVQTALEDNCTLRQFSWAAKKTYLTFLAERPSDA